MKKGDGLLIGVSVAVIGVLGYFLLKKAKATPQEEPAENPIKQVGGMLGALNTKLMSTLDLVKGATVPYGMYASTASTLNVRDKASTSGKIVKTLDNIEAFYAKPSKFTGWHEVSLDGKSSIGFVSSQFLRKL
jgi:uncharacterized protein YgiM (DUF1202 family)